MDDIKKLLINKFNINVNDFCEYNFFFIIVIILILFKIVFMVVSEIIIVLWEVKLKEILVIFLRFFVFIVIFFKLNVFLEMLNFCYFFLNFIYVGMFKYFWWDMILLKL